MTIIDDLLESLNIKSKVVKHGDFYTSFSSSKQQQLQQQQPPVQRQQEEEQQDYVKPIAEPQRKLKRTASERYAEDGTIEKKSKAPVGDTIVKDILTVNRENVQIQDAIIQRISLKLRSFPIASSKHDAEDCFYGSGVLQISIPKYIERFIHVANVWADDSDGPDSTGVRCGVLALYLLSKTQTKISQKSIHRLFGIAFILSLKFTEDFLVSNTFWGKVGGFNLEDCNSMEIELLNRLNWNISISQEIFQTEKRNLVLSCKEAPIF